MKKLILIAAILCHILPANAQWQWINPMPPETHYKSVAHVTEQTYVTMGESLILKTQDGGRSWMQTAHPSVTNLNKVLFLNTETGFVVGDDGLLLKSSDGGNSWQEMNTGTESTFWDIFFVNEQLGFIAANGGRVFKTTDGGENWSLQEVPDVWQHLRLIKFFDENTGYVASMHGLFAKTTNGGEDWEVIEEELSFYYINDMHLIDAQTILLASYGGIFKSSDGGVNWEEKLAPDDEEMANFSFVSETTGYVLGHLSRIYKTVDGGESWTNTNLLPDYFLCHLSSCEKAIAFENENHGILVGFENITQLDMQSNTYNSHTQSITTHDIKGAVFINDTTIVAVGNNSLLARSNTNGRTWTVQTFNPPGQYEGVHFIDENTGFAVGNSYSEENWGHRIVKTDDGGNSWRSVLFSTSEESNNFRERLRGIHFPNANTGYAVGSGGVIYKTTNGGEDWVSKESGVSVQLNSVFFTDANTGYACGSSGTIVQTKNGGDTWTIANTPTTDGMFAISFINNSIGFAAVRGWGMVKTINAGENWIWISLPGSPNRIMRDMVFISEQVGYLAGSDYMFTTHDGGESWELNPLPGSPSISGLAARNGNTVVAVGFNGTILRKYTGPEETPLDEDDDQEPPTSIEFLNRDVNTFRVYPNPFDNHIIIKGRFEHSSTVTVYIYDIHGRLIYQTEHNTFGEETFYINTQSISNGIYLLRLTNNQNTQNFKIIKNK
ncbi:YCF48-related protein [Alkalitalea saponilacus]|uniref:Por secretion system C-terminal sorting domain-containing protein n=1 Tax=Alkalitalea saponilacus TaxID=889453 RepID=A0A1T5D4N3_9BACT|nr:YCF48-related protein [Alkalitalea saponilacus]ASB50574.1 hypothetical protein CDL62_16195 [Alkalitalea saponilacus]SKB66586.1 Por secretion system C-terminal sorting domain-containing protein [Alkalitalea saponilacus]